MSDRESIIEACKQEIEYRAAYTCTPYDSEDLEVWEGNWGTVVCIARFNYPWTELQPDGTTLEIAGKRPNIWLEEPPRLMRISSQPPFKVEVSVPPVRCLRPDLVILIFPDGTIKKTGCLGLLQTLVNTETVKTAQNDCFNFGGAMRCTDDS